jgi:hypothetical protein
MMPAVSGVSELGRPLFRAGSAAVIAEHLLSMKDAPADRAARHAAQRWRTAVAILARPSDVVGPVDRPP